ncbi:MAG: hypothetical protein KGQ38_06800 [Actinomycetales bacterium]|nr:hypothetical protein [Actinomycetales bacterium]
MKFEIQQSGVENNISTPDCGYATAEFAAVIPSVMMIGMSILWAISLCLTQIRLQEISFVLARDLARGQNITVQINECAKQGIAVAQLNDRENVTVKATADRSIGILQRIHKVELTAVSVAHIESRNLWQRQ